MNKMHQRIEAYSDVLDGDGDFEGVALLKTIGSRLSQYEELIEKLILPVASMHWLNLESISFVEQGMVVFVSNAQMKSENFSRMMGTFGDSLVVVLPDDFLVTVAEKP